MCPFAEYNISITNDNKPQQKETNMTRITQYQINQGKYEIVIKQKERMVQWAKSQLAEAERELEEAKTAIEIAKKNQ